MTSKHPPNRYAQLHNLANLAGPGDARPTALQIIQDDGLVGNLVGKTMLVTGGSSGLGLETIRALAATGAKVFFTSRNAKKGEAAQQDILRGFPEQGINILDENARMILMDMESLESVRAASEDLKKQTDCLHVLVCNAGTCTILAIPDAAMKFCAKHNLVRVALTACELGVAATDEGRTRDGFDLQFGVNHLAHFLLFQLLEPLLLASSVPAFASRVVMVSSLAHKFGPVQLDDPNFHRTAYDPWMAYKSSKCANIWCANEIDRQYGARGLHGISVHPGGILTGLQASHGVEPAKMMDAMLQNEEVKRLLKSTAQGAATTVLAAVGKDFEGAGGIYMEDSGVAEPMVEGDPQHFPGYAPWAFDEAGEKKLWADSLEMVGLSK